MTALTKSARIFPELRNTTAIITGGASGIGFSIAESFVASGAKVLLVGRDAEKGAKAVSALTRGGDEVRFASVDVSDAAALAKVIEDAAAAWGRLDYLFNNAGNTLVGEVREMTLADWNEVLAVNLNGTVNGVVAAYPIMVKQGSGHIVNTASLSGVWPTPGAVPYVAAKHAVVGMSRALRIEAEPLGIKVSVVCPPLVETPLLHTARLMSPGYGRMKDELPGKPMPSEKCAEIILRGVLRNKDLILPGASAVLSRMYRYMPWANNFISRKFMKQMSSMRDA